jgi:hypothetical protein
MLGIVDVDVVVSERVSPHCVGAMIASMTLSPDILGSKDVLLCQCAECCCRIHELYAEHVQKSMLICAFVVYSTWPELQCGERLHVTDSRENL